VTEIIPALEWDVAIPATTQAGFFHPSVAAVHVACKGDLDGKAWGT